MKDVRAIIDSGVPNESISNVSTPNRNHHLGDPTRKRDQQHSIF